MIKIFHDTQYGMTWVVRIVQTGQHYGKDDALIHTEVDPLVEFFDAHCEHTDLGQFVSRYYRRTLLNHSEGGLCLDGGVKEWVVDAECMSRITRWLKNLAG